jgi:hypothetical protein
MTNKLKKPDSMPNMTMEQMWYEFLRNCKILDASDDQLQKILKSAFLTGCTMMLAQFQGYAMRDEKFPIGEYFNEFLRMKKDLKPKG